MNSIDWLQRTEILIGSEALALLHRASVTVVGLGGVGSFACESLARAGVGHLQLIDYDVVSLSNLNRQLIALHSTIGRHKTEVMRERILDINPEAEVTIYSEFLNQENRIQILKKSDYIIDAIDSIGPKMGMIKDLCTLDIPFISVLGAGNRLNPESIKITSIWNTQGCAFARRLKKLLRRYGVSRDFPVVFSDEEPINGICNATTLHHSERVNDSDVEIAATTAHIPKSIIGSISYIPAIMGMMAAGRVIQSLICAK